MFPTTVLVEDVDSPATAPLPSASTLSSPPRISPQQQPPQPPPPPPPPSLHGRSGPVDPNATASCETLSPLGSPPPAASPSQPPPPAVSPASAAPDGATPTFWSMLSLVLSPAATAAAVVNASKGVGSTGSLVSGGSNDGLPSIQVPPSSPPHPQYSLSSPSTPTPRPATAASQKKPSNSLRVTTGGRTGNGKERRLSSILSWFPPVSPFAESRQDEDLTPDESFKNGKALFEAGDWRAALPALVRAAELGEHAEAMRYLAICNDDDHLANPEVRTQWLARRDRILSDPEGACMHAHSLRAAGEHVEAVSWFRIAADKGSGDARYQLGVYLRKLGDGEEAMEWFEKAADAQNELAYLALAEGYEHGIGCVRDPAAAAMWREKLFQRTLASQQNAGPSTAVIAATAAAVRTATSETQAQARRDFQEAVRSLEWGLWTRGIATLERLSRPPIEFADAIAYLDPDVSPLKNPTGMFWMAAHFERKAGAATASADEAEGRMKEMAIAAGGPDIAAKVGVDILSGPRTIANDMAVRAAAWYAKAASRGGTVPRELSDVLGDKVMPQVAARRRQDQRYEEAVAQMGWGRYEDAFVAIEALANEGHPDSRAMLDPERSHLRNPAAVAALAGRFERRAEFLEVQEEQRRADLDRAAELERCRELALPNCETAMPAGVILSDGTMIPRTSGDADFFFSTPESLHLRSLAAAWKLKSDRLRDEMIVSSVNPLVRVTEGIAALGDMLHLSSALPAVKTALASTAALSSGSTASDASASSAAGAAAMATSASARASKRDATEMVSKTGDPIWAKLDSEYREAVGDVGWGRYEKGVRSMVRLARGEAVEGDGGTRPIYQPAQVWLDPFRSELRDSAAMHIVGLQFAAIAEAWKDSASMESVSPKPAVVLVDVTTNGDGADDATGAASSAAPAAATANDGAWAAEWAEAASAAASAVAAEWFRKAAESGGHCGMVAFGRILMDGGDLCVPTSSRQGEVVRISLGVALGGSSSAPATAGSAGGWQKRSVRDPWQAVVLFMKAWETGGNADAAYEMGKAYARGVEESGSSAAGGSKPAAKAVVERDELKAREWLQRAAGKEHPDAQNLLGEVLLREAMVAGGAEGPTSGAARKQAVAAAEQFKRSADHGCAVGMYNYGSCLLHGIGVEKDETKALLWLTKASSTSKRSKVSSSVRGGGAS
ncbi:hypothetical protein DFJ73DRAFT_831899 [Zopfochytrium polystomum]|nr:hypothetical protein DFJ73DRAFT_831899 [Zopfochytrium polystomum]